MIAVTVLSLVNLCLYIFLRDETFLYTIFAIDFLISALFLFDFIRLFFTAPSKSRYFFKQFGWADLLACIPAPQFNILRIFHLVKACGIIKRAGLKSIREQFNKNRASRAMLGLFFFIILLLEFGSLGILVIESSAQNANILTPSDAIWWVFVTIATVGYGDLYPVTNEGRLFATIVMTVGVGLFVWSSLSVLPPSVL